METGRALTIFKVADAEIEPKLADILAAPNPAPVESPAPAAAFPTTATVAEDDAHCTSAVISLLLPSV